MSLFGGVLHHNDDLGFAGYEIHGTAHALYHFARDDPVRDVGVLAYLQGAQDCEVEVPATDDSEGLGGAEEGSAFLGCDCLLG